MTPRASELRQDVHVHTTFSEDAVSTPAACLAAGVRRRLRRLCFADHAQEATRWLPELVATVEQLRPTVDMEVLIGAETTIVDDTGRLDLPSDLPPVDRLLIADHRFPGAGGPSTPDDIARDLAAGDLDPAEVVERLLAATALALDVAAPRCERPILAHLFSILPKIGLTESDVLDGGSGALDALVDAAVRTHAIVDVNERWGCPSSPVVARFVAAGVDVAPGSSAHDAHQVGHHPHANQTIIHAWELATHP
jgi:putative hydrolase